MKSWKFYADYIKEHPPYSGIHDKEQSKSRRKKMRKFKRKYGFEYSDTWNLDYTISAFILPRIAFLRDHHYGHPTRLCKFAEDGYTVLNSEEADKEWTEILNTIVEGLYLYISTDIVTHFTPEQEETWKKARTYLMEYWENLWD